MAGVSLMLIETRNKLRTNASKAPDCTQAARFEAFLYVPHSIKQCECRADMEQASVARQLPEMIPRIGRGAHFACHLMNKPAHPHHMSATVKGTVSQLSGKHIEAPMHTPTDPTNPHMHPPPPHTAQKAPTHPQTHACPDPTRPPPPPH